VDGPRACSVTERSALNAAVNQVFRPSGGDMARDYPLLFSLENLRYLRVVTDRDAVIAHAGLCVRTVSWGGAQQMVGAVGAVFTRPEHRGRGLGAAVVGDALSCARDEGVALCLVSGYGLLYRRLGFDPAPAAIRWTWPADARTAAGGARVRPFGAQSGQSDGEAGGTGGPLGHDADLDRDLAGAARWNDAEPVHFLRSPADWHALWRAQVAFAWPARWWMVEQGGRPAGYLVVAQRARRQVLELAGDREAVLAAAPLVADEILVPGYDQVTARQADALGWTQAPAQVALAGQWLKAPTTAHPMPWYGLNYV
jgi:GNAT superfamily N-acetyltransferase